MAEYKLVLPSLGEGILEATLINWLKNEGETIEEDDSVVEIATDKVDSDVPSPVSGVLSQKLFQENDVIQVGEVFAIIETDEVVSSDSTPQPVSQIETTEVSPEVLQEVSQPLSTVAKAPTFDSSETESFLSPLVKTIIQKEGLTAEEVNQIHGTGKEGRITKDDILAYLDNREKGTPTIVPIEEKTKTSAASSISASQTGSSSANNNVEIIEMDRMRKLIADYMVESKRISPHVTSFIETDVTTVVQWRNAKKQIFMDREGQKLTFMPIFVWAVAKAIKDFPMINVSVEGDKIIRKKDINIGMATALPSGNLIVPVIKNADQYNIAGLAKYINDLAQRARNNQLKPTEIQGGTYTITNLGTFGNLMGTPIINQPEVAILAVGAIQKKPSVIETKDGDLLGIRQKMYMSHAYDHRVVDGALGGMFLQRVHQYLEDFDINMEI